MANANLPSPSPLAVSREFPRTYFRGIGQVMFQDSAWTGVLFLAGIFWGAFESGTPLVAWGAILGTLSSTVAGYLLGLQDRNGAQGLWGFNGVLVGCAFPTFLGSTVWMWIALILAAAMTTWVRSALDAFFDRYGISSFTFPFVLTTWIFLLAARQFHGMDPASMAAPEISYTIDPSLNMGFGDLVKYWLKGVAQVFLIDYWVTGLFFLAGLAVSSLRAAVWGALSAAVALFIAIIFQAPGTSVASGLYGFSAVLTGIALGATFCNTSWKSDLWALLGVVATVFIQAAMNSLFAPLGLATLTGPFCVGTWLFLFPAYKWFQPRKAS